LAFTAPEQVLGYGVTLTGLPCVYVVVQAKAGPRLATESPFTNVAKVGVRVGTGDPYATVALPAVIAKGTGVTVSVPAT
jgi:hypothetical protein